MIRRIAPLALGLLLSPCAFAQAPSQPPASEKLNGQWYFSSSIGVVDGPEYGYDSSAREGVFAIRYDTSADAGWALEESVGYAFANGVRLEGAASYQAFDQVENHQHIEIFSPFVDTFDIEFVGDRITAAALHLNAYYDFRKGKRLQPYVGAGAGVADIEIQDGVINANETTLSLQAMAGLSFQTSKTTSIFIEGRWQQFPDLEYRTLDISTGDNITADASFSTASLRAGLRLNF